MMLLCCLSAMAQIELGAIKFSLGEGKKISATTGKISVSFPEATGIEDPTATTFVLEGNFGNEDLAFDGVEGTFASGVVFDLADFGIEPAKDYTLKITSVKVGGTDLAQEGGYSIGFKTRGAERKMSWSFVFDEAIKAQILEEGTANADGADQSKYIDISGSKGERCYVPARNYEEIFLPDGNVLPMTEDLTFRFGEKSFYLGFSGNFPNIIAFNGNNQYMTIPDCQVGDVITFNANRSTKYSAGKTYTLIQAMDGAAIAPDGYVSASGVQDSIQLGSAYTNYKFEVQTAGDITFRFSNCLMKSIEIVEGQEKLPRNYNVVARYTSNDNTIDLKELVGKTEGMTGSTIKANYPYWLADADGNVYTHGTKGNEFVESFDLKNGEGDTTFVINYKKTDYTGVVYLSEGEEIQNAVECSHANAAIRASNCKAGYVLEDTKLVTLQPGTYKIRAVIFDANKTPGYVVTLTKGEGELNEIYLSASATNWTETESDLLTITEPTDIVLKAGGSGTTGLDAIIIYASTDAPDDPDAIIVAKAGQKAAVRKVAKAGQIIIESEAGAFNAAGAQVK